MALVGIFLLPSDYRAGAEIAHGHSLVHLWVDAIDGTVRHAHDYHGPPDSASALTTSWLDPLIGDPGNVGTSHANDWQPDVAEHQESAPIASGVQLLLTMVFVPLALGVRLDPVGSSDRPVAGLTPRIVLPPPRWTPHPA
jgi:hypothetical protein